MTILEDVRSAVGKVGTTDNARLIHWRLVYWLKSQGFKCQREVRADYFNGLRICAGKMDVVATKGSVRVGIEIDRNSPREKSILKLRGMDLTHRVIVLRNPMKKDCPYLKGIDAVFVTSVESGVRGRVPTNAHAAEVTTNEPLPKSAPAVYVH
jgi:hypothetical protein